MVSPEYQAKLLVAAISIVAVFAFATPASAATGDLTNAITNSVNQTTQGLNDTIRQAVNPATSNLRGRFRAKRLGKNNEIKKALKDARLNTQQQVAAINESANELVKSTSNNARATLESPGQLFKEFLGRQNTKGVIAPKAPARRQSISRIRTQRTIAVPAPTPSPVQTAPAVLSAERSFTHRINGSIRKFVFPFALTGILAAFVISEFLTDRKNPKLQRVDSDQEVAF